MAKTYDTGEIRRIAGKIRALAEDVKEEAKGTAYNCAGNIAGGYRGTAANELDNQLDDLFADIGRTGSALSGISSMLEKYARALDLADELLSKMIGNH